MALRGFIIVIVLWIWFNRFSGRGSNGRNWLNRVRVENHKKIILDGHIVAPAVGRAGDGKICRGFRVGRHNAAGIADGLRISPFANAERKTIGRITKFVTGFVGDAHAKNERVFGIEAKCLHDSYRIVGAIQNARLFFKIPILHLGDSFRMVCLQQGSALALSSSASRREGVTGSACPDAELSGGTSNVTDNSGSSLSTSSRTYVLLFHRMLTFVTAFLVSARTEKKDEPLVWAMRKAAGFCGSIVTCAASIAEIGPGKLMVVTR